jgi:hypothetical protein
MGYHIGDSRPRRSFSLGCDAFQALSGIDYWTLSIRMISERYTARQSNKRRESIEERAMGLGDAQRESLATREDLEIADIRSGSLHLFSAGNHEQ